MKNNPARKIHGMKCLNCPYYNGQIKCEKDPCPECIKTKRKNHPFAMDTTKSETIKA